MSTRSTGKERKQAGERRGSLFSRVSATILASVMPSMASALSEGDPAPRFSFAGSDGKTYTLDQLLEDGKQAVVLAFFPKAFTPG